MADFISALYRGGGKGLFDAAAVHPYAATPSDALATVREARSVLDRLGDPGARLWITEVGWASAGQPSGLTVGPQRQADYVTQIFNLAAQNREQLGLDGVIWYSLNDTPGPLWPGHCGLFNLGRHPQTVVGRLRPLDGRNDIGRGTGIKAPCLDSTGSGRTQSASSSSPSSASATRPSRSSRTRSSWSSASSTSSRAPRLDAGGPERLHLEPASGRSIARSTECRCWSVTRPWECLVEPEHTRPARALISAVGVR